MFSSVYVSVQTVQLSRKDQASVAAVQEKAAGIVATSSTEKDRQLLLMVQQAQALEISLAQKEEVRRYMNTACSTMPSSHAACYGGHYNCCC